MYNILVNRNYAVKQNKKGCDNLIKIKECRLKHNLRQRELSTIINVPPNTLSQWETGLFEPPLDKIIEIAKYFNVSTDYLLGVEPERGSPGKTNTA